ncbi:MAG: transporter [Mucilaginibacter sp.]|nr:transporter [Mucilaginibacter sp.]
MTDSPTVKTSRNVILLVCVASLGYFVDVYDLMIFSIVRVKSLQDIGIADADIRLKGVYVINMQMFGLLLGGILWGILGDKLGRIKVLFGSILVYSLANFANGMVHDIDSYAIIRFIGGVGLAGELGAGITLVSEALSKEKRGYGTMMISVVGLLGAVVAGMAGKYDWRTAYYIGGGLGMILLLLRMGTFESGLYKNVAKAGVSKGNIFILFTNRKRFLKYMSCILIGAPLWYVIGIILTLSPEFTKALGAKETITAGTGIMYSYAGAAIGNILAAILAQVTRSRKLTMLVFLVLDTISISIFLSSTGITNHQFILLCLLMGVTGGYFATLVTIAAEQFGTNIRSTVATTVPNFIRATLIPINALFGLFVAHYGMIKSGYIMLFALTGIAIFSLSQLKESFSKDLDYVEVKDTAEPELAI